jgi:uncharacterized protein (DUF952 family)
MTGFIYHITARSVWSAGKKSGEYRTDSIEREGFIHCSTAAQILRVAQTYYTGQHGLVILMIDPTRLQAEVRWEPGTDKANELFPHIHGPLNREAVVRVFGFEANPNGTFSLPEGLV